MLYISQCSAILNYVGSLAHLTPASEFARAKSDEVLNAIEDYFSTHVATTMKMPDAEKIAARKKIESESLPWILGRFERLLAANPSGWFAGDSLSVADFKADSFWVFLTSGMFDPVSTDCMKGFPLIVAHHERMQKVIA